jgi:hypothetical protein
MLVLAMAASGCDEIQPSASMSLMTSLTFMNGLRTQHIMDACACQSGCSRL